MQREATARADLDSALLGPASGVIAIYLDLLASRFGLPPRLHQTGAMVYWDQVYCTDPARYINIHCAKLCLARV